MSPSARLRVAGVGAGYFSQFHYGSWRRIPEVELVACCDQDLSKAQAWGVPAFDRLPDMLATVQPDLLDIILPPEGHRVALAQALEAGVRAIICQKPFGVNLDEARAMAQDAAEAGATLVIHENFRFQPWYRAIKAALDAGRVGTLQQATFRMRPGDGQGPNAYLDRQPYFQQMERFLVHETAVHWVDTFRFLMGDPTAVYADLQRLNPVIAGEDAAVILFDHPRQVRALFDGNRHLDHASDNLRRTMGEALFEGTEGSISLRGDGTVWLRAFGSLDAVEILGSNSWEGFGGDCVHALQNHVVSGLLHQTPIENQALDYLTVIAIEQAIYTSAATGRKCKVETP
ncbi:MULTISPECIES: Gfo/Idh/MocA family protein [unclassified Ruegeria]|uniref:Gfo/Idh/MocA family protein n=1 Tax=unclassified Ruegeria TaxID=2625375 RepID=UPI00148768B0|nr:MULTISPECIES: Gfo/Idh/MocA family oxidoreductase [unclassified Ruegeria]